MPTRNVVLTDQQQDMIDSLVRSGRYQNASEVLREGLRLVERREAEDGAKLAALKAAADVAWEQVEEGRYLELAEDEVADIVATIGRQVGEQLNRR